MKWFDFVRFLSMVAASITYIGALANLIISFQVLKPRPFSFRNFSGSGGGFIWLHIVCVTIPFQGFVTWGIIEVMSRVGKEPTWRPFALMIFCMLISIGYAVIYRVEKSRLLLQTVVSER